MPIARGRSNALTRLLCVDIVIRCHPSLVRSTAVPTQYASVVFPECSANNVAVLHYHYLAGPRCSLFLLDFNVVCRLTRFRPNRILTVQNTSFSESLW